jgi:hypothetical protein
MAVGPLCEQFLEHEKANLHEWTIPESNGMLRQFHDKNRKCLVAMFLSYCEVTTESFGDMASVTRKSPISLQYYLYAA